MAAQAHLKLGEVSAESGIRLKKKKICHHVFIFFWETEILFQHLTQHWIVFIIRELHAGAGGLWGLSEAADKAPGAEQPPTGWDQLPDGDNLLPDGAVLPSHPASQQLYRGHKEETGYGASAFSSPVEDTLLYFSDWCIWSDFFFFFLTCRKAAGLAGQVGGSPGSAEGDGGAEGSAARDPGEGGRCHWGPEVSQSCRWCCEGCAGE